jgi:hypothetical protein
MHWLGTRGPPPSVAFSSLALLSESLTLRNYKGSQHPLGSGHQALSAPLQDGLRFFPDELPDAPPVRLAVTLPAWFGPTTADSRFTTFRVHNFTGRLGPLRPPVARRS